MACRRAMAALVILGDEVVLNLGLRGDVAAFFDLDVADVETLFLAFDFAVDVDVFDADFRDLLFGVFLLKSPMTFFTWASTSEPTTGNWKKISKMQKPNT